MKNKILGCLILLNTISLVNAQQLDSGLREFVDINAKESNNILKRAEGVLADLSRYNIIGLTREVGLIRTYNDSIKSIRNKLAARTIEDSEAESTGKKVNEWVAKAHASWDKIQFALEFQNEIERENERYANQYFNLWNIVFQRRAKITKLYVKEEEVNFHFGGATKVEKTYIKKKRLYEAGSEIYDNYMLKLKNLNQCNYYERIQILNDAKVILVNLEKLLPHENTRKLEKSLKQELSIEEKLELINSFTEAGGGLP